MNAVDAVVLISVGVALACAVVHAFRAWRRRGGGCGCGCSDCTGCDKKK